MPRNTKMKQLQISIQRGKKWVQEARVEIATTIVHRVGGVIGCGRQEVLWVDKGWGLFFWVDP